MELVINCSEKHYNLGAKKLFEWRRSEGVDVKYFDGDPGLFGGTPKKVWVSCVFSWHGPLAAEIALRYKPYAEVEAGGPGLFALSKWWKEQTGLDCTMGLDNRFESQIGTYRMTFASRGCPVGCYFCIVPKLEGKTFTLNRKFLPAPILCDNNISALPDEFQDFILARYQETGTILLDCNSGFEPLTFTEQTFKRWNGKFRGPWRFAFDVTSEKPQVMRMMNILKDVRPGKKQVYVLIGNEPVEQCLERARKVIDWGGEPYCQPMMPLNALSREDITVRYDWTFQKLKDVARYYNRHIWRNVPLNEYKPRVNEAAFSV